MSKDYLPSHKFRNHIKTIAPYAAKTPQILAVLNATSVRNQGTQINTCISYVEAFFPDYFTRLFVKKDMEATFKHVIMREMFDYLKTSFQLKLEQADWLDDDARVAFLNKVSLHDYITMQLNLMTAKIGYPSSFENLIYQNEMVGKINVIAEDFTTSAINALQNLNYNNFKLLSRPVDPGMWSVSPLSSRIEYVRF